MEIDGGPLGIITDRDMVTRAVADGQDPGAVRWSEICTPMFRTVTGLIHRSMK